MFQEKNTLPEDWEIKKLGKVISLVYGKGLPRRDRKAGEVPVYGSNGVIGYHNKPLIKQDTIVVGRKGSVGEIHLVLGPSWPIDTTYYVEIKAGSLLKFIYYLLRSIDLAHLDQSTAIPGINRNAIYNLNVMIPSIEIQQKIVARLDAFFEHYNELKKEKQKAKEKYEQILQSAIASLIPQKELPVGWKCKLIRELVEIKYGKGLPRKERKKGKIAVYGSNGIVGYHSEALVNHDTIIIGRKGSVGAINFAEDSCWPIDTTYFVEIKEGVSHDLEFLYYLLCQLELVRLDVSTTIPGIRRDDIYKIKINFPETIEEQRKILAKIRKIVDFKSNMDEQQKNIDFQLEQLPKAVLSKAFKGELVS